MNQNDLKSLRLGKFSISLQKGYSALNASTYLVAVLFSITAFVFINASQAFVLIDSLRTPVSEIGSATSILSLTNEITILLFAGIFGILSDLLGRRFIFTLGFLLIGLGITLYPFAPSLALLVVFRVVFGMGAAACSSMLTVCIADIAQPEDRGKLAGSSGLGSGLGALFALFVLLPLPLSIGSRNTFLIVGGGSFVLAVVSFFGYGRHTNQDVSNEGIPINYTNPSSIAQEEATSDVRSSTDSLIQHRKHYWSSFISSARDGICVTDPNIILGYLTSFFARSDSTSITLFIPLWVYHHYIITNQCVVDTNSPFLKDLCPSAYIRSSIISGVCQTIALVSAPFLGFLCDRVNPARVVLFSSALVSTGYFFLAYAEVNGKLIFLYITLIGLGEMGLIISTLSLVTDPKINEGSRGGVGGISGVCGGIGILITSVLGGLLFDSWWAGAPFFILGVGNAMLTIAAVVVAMINPG